MKKIKFKIVFAIFFLVFASCNTDELADLNINPNAVNEIDMSFLLAQAQLQNYSHRYGMHSLETNLSGYVQLMAALNGAWNVGDKYLEASLNQGEFFSYSYLGPVVTINEVVEHTKDDPDLAGLYAVARITRVIIMHRLTDLYGDIPYFEGGKGFIDVNFLPKYDPQAEIYADMLKELEESAIILSGGATFQNPGQDLVYGGDLEKWERLANSLMLRLGMRMSKVDPTAAEAWVKKAVSRGVLSDNNDNAMIIHTEGPTDENSNPRYNAYELEDSQKLSKTFVDWLKGNDDPRLMIFSGGVGPKEGPKDMEPANQNGMPSGYDVVTIKDYEGVTEDVDIQNTYSRNNLLLANRVAPSLLLVYPEVELLQAEAAQRGWLSSDAATHYNKGVIAAMTMYDVFQNLPTYATEADANEYLTAHPYVAADGIEMIATQYWALNFTNLPEAFANWRRTGFPELTPTEYVSSRTDGVIPRRFVYLPSESATNATNLNEAIGRQGPDTHTTRVWWDVQ